MSCGECDELWTACARLRELIYEDYPRSQGGMMGSATEVVLCAVDYIKRVKGENNEKTKV